MSLTTKVVLNASAAAVGRAILVLAGIASVGMATRYLGLEAYGALTTATAFSSLFAPLAELGVASITARELAKRPAEQDRLIASAFTLVLGLAVFTAVVAITAVELLYSGDADRTVRGAAVVLILAGVPLAGPVTAVSAYFFARQRAWVSVLAAVGGSLTTLATLLVAIALDWGFYGVVAAYAATTAGYGAVMLGFSVGKVRLRLSFDRALTRQIMVWALPVGLTVILTTIFARADVLLLSFLSTKAEVGLFGVGYKVVDALLMLPYFVTVTLMPEFARRADQRERLDALVERALRLTQVFVVPFLVSTFVFADEVAELVGGAAFERSAAVIRILLFGVATAFVTAVLVQAMLALNRQGQTVRLTALILVVNVAVGLALIPSLGARGAAIAFAASQLAYLAGMMALYGRGGRVPTPERRPALFVATCVAVGVALLKYPLTHDSGSAVVILAVGGTATVAAYLGSLYALGAMPAEIHQSIVLPAWMRLKQSLRFSQ